MVAKVQFYNTLSAKKEAYEGKTPGEVNIYSCGPTVYSFTHVGNARASLTADFVVRVFQLAGFKTRFVSNITDIDDKIIKAANENAMSSAEVAVRFEKQFLGEMKDLGLDEPDVRPRATEHIPEITEMIQSLIDKGKAYVAQTPFGNDVYFRVLEFADYGKLSKKNTDDLMVGARIEAGEMKENPLDFVLWKASKENEPSWDSPWGPGRPGWHIECSAMIQKHFENGIDIHMGGLDLTFPHHENEIAQSECHNGQEFSRYWIHCGMLTIEREKMSKSIGNVFLTKDFQESYGSETLRLLLLEHHYRSPIDFSEEGILRTEALVERLYHAKEIIKEKGVTPNEDSKLVAEMKTALFDDFNSAKALGFLLKQIRMAFKEDTKDAWAECASGFTILEEVYRIGRGDPSQVVAAMRKRRFARSGKDENYCQSVEERLNKRQELRAQKRFDDADKIREELEKEGVLIMDGPDGTAWRLQRSV